MRVLLCKLTDLVKIRTVKKKNERQIKSKLKGKVQVVMANDKVTKRREGGWRMTSFWCFHPTRKANKTKIFARDIQAAVGEGRIYKNK